MEKFNPGICEITQAIIIPYQGYKDGYMVPPIEIGKDITPLITGFQINQGMNNVSMSGTIDCIDNVGFLENLPLRGEEELHFEIKSFDLGTTRSIVARIIKISNVNRTESGNGVGYTLQWISKLSYNANIKNIITSYNGKEGQSVIEDLFSKHYSKLTAGKETWSDGTEKEQPSDTKSFRIQSDPGRFLWIAPTRGILRVTIPNYSPSEAIQFITKRIYSKSTIGPSSTFRFFERWDGFHAVTDEWLHVKAKAHDDVPTLNYFTYSSKQPEDAAVQVSTIQEFVNDKRVDVADEVLSGSYTNSFLEIDLLRHRTKLYTYKYNEEVNKYKDSGGRTASLRNDIHSEEFIKDTFNQNNSKQFMIIREYSDKESGSAQTADEKFYRETTAHKIMYNQHANATSATIALKGRLDLMPGMITDINIRELDASNKSGRNKQLSGKYLITGVINKVDGNVLNTICKIVKYDWSDGAGDLGKE